jgi:ABC-type polysaccharide/polyol phosphate export permease
LTGIIEGYRASLFGRPVDWASLGVSTLITLAFLVYAVYAFRQMEKTFADVI